METSYCRRWSGSKHVSGLKTPITQNLYTNSSEEKFKVYKAKTFLAPADAFWKNTPPPRVPNSFCTVKVKHWNNNKQNTFSHYFLLLKGTLNFRPHERMLFEGNMWIWGLAEEVFGFGFKLEWCSVEQIPPPKSNFPFNSTKLIPTSNSNISVSL